MTRWTAATAATPTSSQATRPVAGAALPASIPTPTPAPPAPTASWPAGADVDIGLRSFSAAFLGHRADRCLGRQRHRAPARRLEQRHAGPARRHACWATSSSMATYGNDKLYGNDANNTLRGGGGDDTMDGGNGSDTYLVSGNQAGGWSSFAGFDTYADTGASGTDRIVASGRRCRYRSAQLQCGLPRASSRSMPRAPAAPCACSATRATTRWTCAASRVLGNIVIDGYLRQRQAVRQRRQQHAARWRRRRHDGRRQRQRHLPRLRQPGRWLEQLCRLRYLRRHRRLRHRPHRGQRAPMSISVCAASVRPSSGIEQIDASGASGTVRLLGDSSNDTLDLRGVTRAGQHRHRWLLTATTSLYGNDANNTLRGGGGDDTMDGGNGSDTYLVSGNQAGGWSSFAGFDTYADTGACRHRPHRGQRAPMSISVCAASVRLPRGIEQIDASRRQRHRAPARRLEQRHAGPARRHACWATSSSMATYGNDKLVRQRRQQHAARWRRRRQPGRRQRQRTPTSSQVTKPAAGAALPASIPTPTPAPAGTDRIVASGADVDIGLRSFSAASSGHRADRRLGCQRHHPPGRRLEQRHHGPARRHRWLGNIVIDGAYGDDRLIGGTSRATSSRGGSGNDLLVGGVGSGQPWMAGSGNDLLLGSQGRRRRTRAVRGW
jgi:Ca2+-binding RTX toxin-like protein